MRFLDNQDTERHRAQERALLREELVRRVRREPALALAKMDKLPEEMRRTPLVRRLLREAAQAVLQGGNPVAA